jgi:cell division GTPase FtsZ
MINEKSLIQFEKIGASQAILSPHMRSEDVKKEMYRYPLQTIIGLGQGGGRMAAELSRFGFPVFLVNSSKSDMDEHAKLIPEERRIITKSEGYPDLEGTAKNAQLGYQIAVENKEAYKKLATSDEVQDAHFVWVTVSLGGGTGNGALKVALAYLMQVRSRRSLPNGKVPLGIICSLPSLDEKGSAFRANALAGISILQKLVSQNQIGSIIVIDNEKMNNYYAENPLTTYGGTKIDAKSYSNMVIACLLAEISSLPLLHGRSVYDRTELLDTLSTPGWLSIAKMEVSNDNENIEQMIHNLFNQHEVLAEYNTDHALTGSIVVINPTTKDVEPKLADDVYHYTSNLLNTSVNLGILSNDKVKNTVLYGLTVHPTEPKRIAELNEEFKEWKQIEEEKEALKRRQATESKVNEFDDFFSNTNQRVKNREKMTMDDLSFNDDFDDEQPAKRLSADDITDDFDF